MPFLIDLLKDQLVFKRLSDVPQHSISNSSNQYHPFSHLIKTNYKEQNSVKTELLHLR